MRKSNISIFVPHIGCPHRCSFCNQNAITGQAEAPTPQDVCKAVERALQSNESGDYTYEIAFFGGSFTAIDRDYMISLLEAAYKYVQEDSVDGIRISTRPDFINEEILGILKKYGVTAIELGCQSMDDDVLRTNMRGHTSDDVRDAAKLIKDNGFELGVQMMTNLLRSTRRHDIDTANKLIELQPDTVRIYPTVVLKDTYIARVYQEGRYTPSTLEQTVALCADLVDMFEKSGVKVIRVGLHSSPDIKRNMLAGGYHECLGELVESRRMFNKITRAWPGKYDVYINEKSISKLLGNKKSNIKALERLGYRLKIKYKNSLAPNELELHKCS